MMNWNIPGTVLAVPMEETDHIQEMFSSMFLAGNMALGQISNITGLEPHTVPNWVKRGFLAPPRNKRYSLNQLCRILNINMLKSALPLEQICGLLQYINGSLEDESDDLIDDARLYFLFLRLAAYHRQMHNPAGRDTYLQQILAEYKEPVPGARERVEKVLQIMLTAWAASQLRQTAEKMVNDLKGEN